MQDSIPNCSAGRKLSKQDRRNILPVSSPFEKQQWQSVSSTLQSKIQKEEQTKLETKR